MNKAPTSEGIISPVPSSETGDSLSFFRSKAVLAVSILYGFAMAFNYEQLSYWWAYIGFQFIPIDFPSLVGIVLLAAVPSLFLPSRPKNLVQLSAWTLHFTVFMPGIIIPPLQAYVLGAQSYWLIAMLLISAIGYNLLSRLDLRTIKLPRLPQDLFWGALLAVHFVLNAMIYVVFGDSLSLAGIEDVYEQRAAANAAAGTDLIVYAIGALTGAINPFLIAYGMRARNYLLVTFGLASQLLAYSSLAGKIILFSTAMVLFAMLLFDREARIREGRLMLVFLLTAAIGLLWLPFYNPNSGLWGQLTSILYMRTLYLPGVLIGAYTEFFSTFPVTYLSHSIVGRFLFDYPYGALSVGQVVGAHVTPGSGYNYNNYIATFLAGDGIASFGLSGIPFAALVGWLVVSLLARLMGAADRAVALAASLPFVVLLSNSSIFTSLLTGGGLLLALIIGASSNLEKHHQTEAGSSNEADRR